MHELSLSRAIVETALRHAEGRPVSSVQMRIGAMRQVVPESLDFYFALASRGSDCEGAALEVTQVPARLRCGGCGAEWEPELPVFLCAECGGAAELVAGSEFEIESIVVEEKEEAGCTGPS